MIHEHASGACNYLYNYKSPPPPMVFIFNPDPRDILVIAPSIDPFGLHPPAHLINQNLHSDPRAYPFLSI
jgi:hypothetical protein